MKHTLVFSVFIFLAISIFGQGIKKEVENGIFVTFPSTPEYQTTAEASSYTAKTTNCYYMVLIQRNAIPNYAEFVKAEKTWTEAQKKQFRDALLDNAVKGKLDYTGSKGNISNVKIGDYYGRNVEYSAINPATGQKGKRYLVMLSVRDRLVTFECMFLQNINSTILEKDEFINSISTSNQKSGLSNNPVLNPINNIKFSDNPDIQKYIGNVSEEQLQGVDINNLLANYQPFSDQLFNPTLMLKILIVGIVIIFLLLLSLFFIGIKEEKQVEK